MLTGPRLQVEAALFDKSGMWSFIAFLGFVLLSVGVLTVIWPLPALRIPTRGRAVVVVIAGLVVLVIGAVNAAPPQRQVAEPKVAESKGASEAPPPAKAPEWTRIASWDGSGIKDTESFETTSREWRVSWKTSREAFAGAGILQLYVHNADDGGLVSLAANKQGAGEDVSYVRTKPGRYYVKINSANVDWSVSIEEHR